MNPALVALFPFWPYLESAEESLINFVMGRAFSSLPNITDPESTPVPRYPDIVMDNNN